MTVPTIVYAKRSDATQEAETAALANICRLILDSTKKRGRLPDKSGPEDTKGSKHDSRHAQYT